MAELKEGSLIEKVRGILVVTDTGKDGKPLATKKGNPMLFAKVGDIEVGVFDFSKFPEIKVLAGKFVIMDYYTEGKYTRYADIKEDTERAKDGIPPSEEAMSKDEWAQRDHVKNLIALIDTAARLLGHLIMPASIEPSQLKEEVEEIAFAWYDHICIKAAYRSRKDKPEESQPSESEASAPPQDKVLPSSGKDKASPEDMSWERVHSIAKVMGFPVPSAVSKALGVKNMAQWAETKELALERLLEVAQSDGRCQEYKSWREISPS